MKLSRVTSYEPKAIFKQNLEANRLMMQNNVGDEARHNLVTINEVRHSVNDVLAQTIDVV